MATSYKADTSMATVNVRILLDTTLHITPESLTFYFSLSLSDAHYNKYQVNMSTDDTDTIWELYTLIVNSGFHTGFFSRGGGNVCVWES